VFCIERDRADRFRIISGGTGVKKRRKSLVHRLILNDQTFLCTSMTSTLQEIISDQPRLLASLSCSSPSCLRNRTLISTADLLQLHLHDADDERLRSSIRPLEDPFPIRTVHHRSRGSTESVTLEILPTTTSTSP
jgi:hypothetical protein